MSGLGDQKVVKASHEEPVTCKVNESAATSHVNQAVDNELIFEGKCKDFLKQGLKRPIEAIGESIDLLS